MVLIFYNLALLTVLLAGAPWWLWRMATTQKYRQGLGERLGRVPPAVAKRGQASRSSGFMPFPSARCWQSAAWCRRSRQPFRDTVFASPPPPAPARSWHVRVLEPTSVFYCPLDLPWAVRAYLNALRPRMLILAETEFWPNLLNGCFRRDIPVAVVNARISDRSWPRYQMLRSLWRPILGRLRRVLAQSTTDAERLIELGCEPAFVSVSGNLKFDVRAAQEAEATSILKTLGSGMRILVAGSTLEGEEAALLEAWPRVLAADPNLIMVLAPRHPERFAAVAALLAGLGKSSVRRSEWKGKPVSAIPALLPGQIVLLDTIGELASVYSLAAVAFVGGSLVPSGGHNPLEPAQFGVPIVMGPHYANFRTITEDLRSTQRHPHRAARRAGGDVDRVVYRS